MLRCHCWHKANLYASGINGCLVDNSLFSLDVDPVCQVPGRLEFKGITLRAKHTHAHMHLHKLRELVSEMRISEKRYWKTNKLGQSALGSAMYRFSRMMPILWVLVLWRKTRYGTKQSWCAHSLSNWVRWMCTTCHQPCLRTDGANPSLPYHCRPLQCARLQSY